ncbi:MAG: glycosyltransferase family 2 protein [Candidatus Sericytochromatia bacterium]|nr:glycosyltransferase family 2 protein [Candidatus Sericytochromatia bacterium]
MKLVIQIPCYNEAATLPVTLAALPLQVPGVDRVEILVIDDGSTDQTAEVARRAGVDQVLELGQHKGLARAFVAGLDAALRMGADVIVNTDADNQYAGEDIGSLVAPVLKNQADLVVGERWGPGVEAFSPLKRRLQKMGSWVVRQASNTRIPDTTSGFRAISREAAMRTIVFSDFTYTLETLIQAGNRGLRITHVPVRTNRAERPSRLFDGIWQYTLRSAATILRIYAMYQPLRVFALAGLSFALPGFLLLLRFLYFYWTDGGGGHVQSLLVAAACGIIGFQMMLFGVLADLTAGNRRVLEDVLFHVKKVEYGGQNGERNGLDASSQPNALCDLSSERA